MVLCGSLDTVANGIIMDGTSHVGAERKWICNHGYWIDQSQGIKEGVMSCSINDGQWYPVDMLCEGE